MITTTDRVTFTEEEMGFFSQARLARLATICPGSVPHVVPIAYEFDGTYFYFSGRSLEKSLKFKNILRNKNVAVVIDDVVSVYPWRARGVEIRGEAQVVESNGRSVVRITPLVKRSWGLN